MKPTLLIPSTTTRQLVGLLTLLCTVLFIMAPRSAAAETAVTNSAVIKLNDPLVAGGNINVQQISPDNSTVVFTADAEIDGVNELYSVPIGGGTVTKLNPDLSGGRDVNSFAITPDSGTVVFRADVDTVNADELYSVPIGGGTATKLNDPVTSGGRIFDFTLSPDGSTVVYIGDQDTFDITELYSVPVGGGTVTKLSPNTLTTTREVLFTRRISADSSTVVYLGDQNTDGVNELFSVPIGGGTVTQLNDPLPTGGGVGLFGIKLSPDGSTVVYSAEQETINVHEIFSVPIGGGTVTKLNSTLPANGDIFEFKISPDSSTVVYRGGQDTAGIDELFAVPIGGGTPIKVSEPGVNLFNYTISADGSTVVYQTSTGGTGVDELFSVPIGGGTITQLNGPLAVGETVDSFELSKDSSTLIYTTEPIGAFDALSTGLFSVPINGGTITQLSGPFAENSGVSNEDISPDSSMVLFRADQDTAGVTELFIVPICGGSTTKLNDPLVSGGDVNNFRFSPDSSIVIYEADQDTDEVDELYSVSLDIALNLAPVAADDAYATTPDTPLSVTAPGVLGNDSDADGDGLTAVLVSNPSNGILNFNTDGSFTYTPNAGFIGSDSFTYNANDGLDDSNIATVTIAVDPEPNEAPVAANDVYNTDPDTPLTVLAPGVLANDADADDDGLTAVLVSNPSNGILNLNPDGSFTYTPNASFIGSDSFTYKANDGLDDSNIATVTITIDSGPNQAPVATNDTFSTDLDTSLTVWAPGVLGNDSDADGDGLTAVLVSWPSNGTLNLNADGSFTYTPNAGFTGSDSFTYKANDGSDDSNIATVNITVGEFNVYLPLILK